jgi:hypothetical protein
MRFDLRLRLISLIVLPDLSVALTGFHNLKSTFEPNLAIMASPHPSERVSISPQVYIRVPVYTKIAIVRCRFRPGLYQQVTFTTTNAHILASLCNMRIFILIGDRMELIGPGYLLFLVTKTAG